MPTSTLHSKLSMAWTYVSFVFDISNVVNSYLCPSVVSTKQFSYGHIAHLALPCLPFLIFNDPWILCRGNVVQICHLGLSILRLFLQSLTRYINCHSLKEKIASLMKIGRCTDQWIYGCNTRSLGSVNIMVIEQKIFKNMTHVMSIEALFKIIVNCKQPCCEIMLLYTIEICH